MRNKRTLLVPILIAFSGCATDGRISTAEEAAASMVACSKGNLKFHVGDSYLRVTPPNKCVEKGMTYEATIQAHGSYTIVEGDISIQGAESWLTETNSPDANKILIVVPGGQADGLYKYELVAPGVGTLDPSVRVN